MRFAVPLCGVVAALVAAPGASASCTSLRHVKAFKGQVTEKIGASASGDWPQDEGGGTQTIQLGRAVVGAEVHLGDKRRNALDYKFSGPITGGQAVVDDFYEDTGTDHAGELKYDGHLQRFRGANGGDLIIQRTKCRYKLAVSFAIVAAYEGDPEVDEGVLVTFGAFSETKGIPNDLKLSGDAQKKPRPEYPDVDPLTFTTNALFTLNGGWMQELIILFDCGSPFPTGDCVEEDNPVFDTPASISWHLHPVFKKK